MPQITLLSQETIDKIAAGEVVERPSSVVKELVENAIDARATAVTVEIKEGGTTFVRITDNGCGIEREQVPLAFLRHSTSKIKSVEDLLCIHSLGFRGEALSSIAAVSQVELITKTYSDLTGTRYVIEGSREMSNDEIGAPDGTTFIVRNLFYNTPARKKFLKTAQTEGNYISDLMERLALSHPDVSFKFISNGQTKMHTSGNSNEKDLIYHIYGRDITAALLPVSAETEYFSVKGFVGKPMISRGNRSYESYFINGRYIKSSLLSKAVEEAYKGFMMQHQYPFCVLYFTMDTELLDVNVHPTKMELRFSNNEEVYRKLYQTIRDVLTHKEFIPAVPVEEKKEEKRPVITGSLPEPFETKRLQAAAQMQGQTRAQESFLTQRSKQLQEHIPPQTQMTQGQNVTQESPLPQRSAQLKEHIPPQTQVMTQGESKTPEPVRTPENLDVFRQLLVREESSYHTDFTSAGSASTEDDSRMQEMSREAGSIPADTGQPTELVDEQPDVRPEPVSKAEALQGAPDTPENLNTPETDTQNVQETQNPQETEDTVVYEQQTLEATDTGFFTPDVARRHRIIGEVFDTYWLIEYEDKLFIIDQHAAHEKVLYERTMARVRTQDFASQTLSPPIILTLSAEEQEMLTRYGEQIRLFGYEVEPFGGKEFAITAIPADFEAIDMKSMFLDMLDDFTNISGREAPELILEKVASMSCKAAIKGGDSISRAEAEQLIDELLSLENPYHCPHGRPTIISMSKYEIEKKFKRIV
ncbi:MAG: DNA mismatch repair endonuclease MutL [Roseburia hominis]|nr:DNA mismatch repair endonuclease MutL [Roseburia hominis]